MDLSAHILHTLSGSTLALWFLYGSSIASPVSFFLPCRRFLARCWRLCSTAKARSRTLTQARWERWQRLVHTLDDLPLGGTKHAATRLADKFCLLCTPSLVLPAEPATPYLLAWFFMYNNARTFFYGLVSLHRKKHGAAYA